MALPRIFTRLFENKGFGKLLRKDIIPGHADTHGASGSDKVSIDASQITSGLIHLDRIPESAKERLVTVPDVDSMYKLTTANAQNGDFVLVKDTRMWYGIVDETKLNNKDGYVAIGATEIADRLSHPVRIILTGVSGESDPWDGSSNATINVTSINEDLIRDALNKINPEILEMKPKFLVQYLASDSIITNEQASCVLCSNGFRVLIDPADMGNGWNCYIKNTSSINKCHLSSNTDGVTIDNEPVFELSPRMSIHLFFDGEHNFVSIDTTPRITI